MQGALTHIQNSLNMKFPSGQVGNRDTLLSLLQSGYLNEENNFDYHAQVFRNRHKKKEDRRGLLENPPLFTLQTTAFLKRAQLKLYLPKPPQVLG